MAFNFIEAIRNRPETVMVLMNEVRYIYWGVYKYLASEGFNGCTGVTIVSAHAAILAHIAPLGDQNLAAKVQEIISYYNTMHPYFPEPRSIIVAAERHNEPVLPSYIAFAIGALEILALPIQIRYYQVIEPGRERLSGQTSIVIDWRIQGEPRVFVNNQEVTVDVIV